MKMTVFDVNTRKQIETKTLSGKSALIRLKKESCITNMKSLVYYVLIIISN